MNRDPVYDGLDEAELQVRRQAALRAKERQDAAFRAQMSTKDGRRFVCGLLNKSGVFWTTYNPKAADIALDMAFAEGRKQLGYELMSQCLSLCPKLYDLMLEESKEDERDTTG